MKTQVRCAAGKERGGRKAPRRRRGGNVGIRRFLPDFQARGEGWEKSRSPHAPGLSGDGTFPPFPRRGISTATLPPRTPTLCGPRGTTDRGGAGWRGANPNLKRRISFSEVKPWA